MSFTNPTGLAAASRIQTDGANIVASHGPAIWDILVANVHDEPFKIDDLAEWFNQSNPRFTTRSARDIVYACMTYFQASDEFCGPRSKVTRVKHGIYRLEDRPEQ